MLQHAHCTQWQEGPFIGCCSPPYINPYWQKVHQDLCPSSMQAGLDRAMHRAGQQLSRINWNSLHLSAPELALMTGAGMAEVLILAAACLHAMLDMLRGRTSRLQAAYFLKHCEEGLSVLQSAWSVQTGACTPSSCRALPQPCT